MYWFKSAGGTFLENPTAHQPHLFLLHTADILPMEFLICILSEVPAALFQNTRPHTNHISLYFIQLTYVAQGVLLCVGSEVPAALFQNTRPHNNHISLYFIQQTYVAQGVPMCWFRSAGGTFQKCRRHFLEHLTAYQPYPFTLYTTNISCPSGSCMCCFRNAGGTF